MVGGKAAYSKVAAPKKPESLAARRWSLFPYLVLVMLVLTGISLFHVWSRVRVVELSLQVAEMRRRMTEVQQENNRLRLEAASLKTPARIESVARGELEMQHPDDSQVVVVR